MQRHRIARAIAGLAAGGVLFGLGHEVQAQTDSAPQRIEITGSSIKRIDGETALPVQVLTRQDIQRSGAATVEELMKTLSVASSTGNLTASSSTSATTGGLSSVSLRGLSSLRTLVLLNGRRLSPYGVGFVGDSVSVDVSSIPLAAVERVEILKDGASAIYGSDAIAGVVNFILRRDFSGNELALDVGDTTQGGGRATRASFSLGRGNLAKDGYNVFLLGNFQDEEPIFGRQRAFARSSVTLDTLNDGTSGNTFPANIVLPDGRLRNPNYPNCAPSVVSAVFEAVGLSNRCRYDPSETMALVPDVRRASLFGALRFKLGASMEGFVEASIYRGEQRTVIQPVPLSDQFALADSHPFFNVDPYNGFSTIVLKPSSAFYPSAYVQGLVGAGNPLPDLLVRYRSVVTGNRDLTDHSSAPRLAAGVKGAVGEWDVDASLLYSASKVREHVNGGYPLLTRILPLLNSGRVNFFGPNSAAILAEAQATGFVGDAFTNSTSLAGLTARAARDLAALGGGPLAVAFGADARRESYKIDPDATIQSGDVSGYGGNFLPVDRGRSVSAVFAELNAPWSKTFETAVALRHDRYQGSGSSTTPKASLRWQPMRELLMRASVGKGFRAPSLGDLYSPQLVGVSASGLNDPIRCPVTGSSLDCATQFPTTTGGNTTLKPERSTNTTLGLVLEPAKDLTLGLDFYRIVISDVIANGIPATTVLGDLGKYGYLVTRGAVDPAFPTLPGRITSISGTNLNLGSYRVKGLDIDARWRGAAQDWGRLSAGLTGSYFIQFDVENTDGTFTSAIDAASAQASGLVNRWRHHLSLTWERGPWEVTVAQNWQKGYPDILGNIQELVEPDATPRRVGSYETYDLQAAYSGFKAVRVVLGVRNLFDRDPPFTNTGGRASFQAGYDPQYGDPRGRFVYARANWSF